MTTQFAPRGQRFRFARRVLASSIAAFIAVPIAAHADLTWDAVPLNGTLEGGTGFWNALDQNWTADGGLTNAPWDSLIATFGGTTGGTVTINSGNVNATGLVFNATGDLSNYTIASALATDTLTLLGTPTITTNADATISAVVAGTAGFTKLGTGALTLSGVNTLSGATRIGAGTLVLNHSLALQNALLNLNPADTGTLSFGTLTAASIGQLTGSRELSLVNNSAAGVALTFTSNGTPTYTGALSGAGSITQSGTSTQTLSGSLSYAGTTTVNSGILVLGGGTADTTANTSEGSIAINGGVLRLDKAAGTLATSATSVAINTGGTLNFGSSTNLLASNLLSANADVTVSGGTLNFSANTGNSAVSQTLNSLTVTGGTMNTTIGTIAAGNVNNITVTNAFNVSGGTPTINSGTVVTAGSFTISGGATLTIGGNHAARNTRLSPNTISLNGGTIQINTGTTVGVMRGELFLASDVNVGGTTASTIARGGSGTASEPAVVLNDAARIFNVADATNSSAADLTIATRLDAGGLVKTGAGTLALNSTGSTFTGNVLVQQGTLQFAGSAGDPTALGAGTKTITVTNNSRLAIATADVNPTAGTKIFIVGTGGATFDIPSGRTMTLDDGTVSYNPGDTITSTTAQLQGSNTLTKVGAGTLTLGGGAGNFSASFTGNINHNLGLLNVTNLNGAGNTGTISVDGSAGPTRLNYGNATVMAIPMNLAFQNGAVFSTSGNSHNLLNTKTLTINSGATDSRIRVDDGAAATVSATNRTFVLNGALNGSGNVELAGPSGATRGVLASSNTQSNFSGTISLDKNVSFENNPRFNGTVASGTGKTIGTATIKYMPQFFSGSSVDALLDLRDNGTGNNQTFNYGNAVDMSLSGGQINVGIAANGSATPSIGSKFVLGTLNLGGGNTLTVNSSNSNSLEFSGLTTLGGAATFTGTSNLNLSRGTTGGTDLTKDGAGTLTIGGSAGTPYTGNTTINAGGIVFGSASAIGGTAASVTAANGAFFGAGFAATQADFVNRAVANANTFVFALGADTANNLSLVGFSGARLGSHGAATMSGNLTPDGTSYRLGGGSAGHVLAISGAGALSGANSLDVGSNGTGAGVVALTGANSFTGSITLSGGELLRPSTNSSLGNVANAITGDGGGIQFATGSAFDLFAVRTVTFGTGGFILDTNGNNFTPSVTISGNSGTGSFTKTGAGTLTFTNVNTFTGATNVNGGVLEFSDPALLGVTSGVGISGGTLRFTGTGAATLGKTVAFGTVAGAATLDVPNANGNLTIDTVISGGPATTNLALTKTGPGTLSLITAVNTFTGDIIVNEGTLSLTGQGAADPTRLGAGAKAVTFNNGSIFRVTSGDFNPSATTKRIVVGAGGAIFNSAGATGITLDDANQFSGTGNLLLAGGVTNLGNAYIAYTGNITVGPGATLRAFNANANPLGDTVGITTVQNGGVLNIQTTGTNNESIFISGTGINSGGALINSGTGVASIGGTVTMTGATSMGGNNTGSLTLTNAVIGAFPITKVGTTTLALGGATGTALETTALNLLGGAFLLNNDGGADVLTSHNQNRLADNLTVNFSNAAVLDLRGVNLTASGSTTETIGAVNFDGQGTLRQSSATPTFTTTTLNFTIGNRDNRGVLLIEPGTVAGTALGTTNRYIASNAPALINGGTMVAPHFIDASNSNFLTYGVNGFVDAAATSTDISVSTATDIVDDADGASLAGPATAFVAKLNGGLTGGSLTLTGGGLIATGTATHSTPINFGSESVLFAPAGATPLFTGLPTASVLVKAGAGSTRFQNTGQINNTGLANALLVVHDGLLEIGDRVTTNDNNAIPATVSAYLTGGGLNFYHGQTIGGLSGTGGTVRVGANTSGTTSKTLTVNQNVNATFAGVIDSDDNNGGDASFTKAGTGTWTYTGSGKVGRVLNVNFGEIVFTGLGSFNSAGTAPPTDRQQIGLNQGGVITLDNTGLYLADRLNTNRSTASPNFAISGGTFNYIGNSSTASTEAFGGSFAGTFGVGSDVMNVVAGTGQTAAVSFGYTFNRNVGASVLIRGTNLGGARGAADVASVVMAGTTTLTGGAGAAGTPLLSIIKGAIADSVIGGVDTYGLATYDTGTDATSGDANDIGVRRLTASEHASTFASGDTALNNVRLTTTVAGIDTATTVNAIHLAGNASIAGTGTLTINSGTILSANNGALGANSLDVANLVFTGGEAIFYTPTDLTVISALTGATVLTKAGSGRLVLAGTNSFTGNPIVNGGLLAIDGNARLGTATNNVNLNNGGGIQATTSFTLDNSGANKRGIILGAASGRIDVPNLSDTFVVSGTISGGVGSVNAAGIGATTGSFARETTVLTKSGPGVLTLTGTNTFTGRLDINAGTVVVGDGVSGSLGANGHVAVNSGGTLKGTGTIGGTVTVNNGGIFAPGNSPGLINTGSLSLASGSTLSLELNSTVAATGYDQVNVSGSVALGGSLSLSLGFAPTENVDRFFVILNDGVDAISGTFAGLPQGATFTSEGYMWQISYQADSGSSAFTGGNDVALMAVPEPSSSVALLTGLCSVLGFRRRRRE